MFNKKSPLSGRFFARGKRGRIDRVLYEADLSKESEDDQGHKRQEERELDFLVVSSFAFSFVGSATIANTFVLTGLLHTFMHGIVHSA